MKRKKKKWQIDEILLHPLETLNIGEFRILKLRNEMEDEDEQPESLYYVEQESGDGVMVGLCTLEDTIRNWFSKKFED